MAGFFQDLLQGAAGTFFGSEFLRDYTHASKTFRPNAYQNAPKFKYLFHVYFQLNPTGLPDANYGLLVKTVKLPAFSFNTVELNQYNRKRIIQTKIKYDPVNITFHDDNGNTVRKLWKSYYNYYYADGTRPQVIFNGARGTGPATGTADATYNSRTQYQPSITGNESWGYQGDTSDPTGKKIPFFKNITIFGFNQHNFVAYTLINPIITNFSHDTYDYAQASGIMENQMTLDYETVVYNEGAIDGKSPGNIVTGFGDEANYDRTLSPIARPGSNANILGQGGLVGGVGGTLEALANGNILGAVQAAGTTYNTFKNVNVLNIAKSEVVSGLTNTLAGTPNRNVNVLTPVYGAVQNVIGTAGAKLSGATSSPQQVGTNYAGKQVP
jgi:hypothetical protein